MRKEFKFGLEFLLVFTVSNQFLNTLTKSNYDTYEIYLSVT